MVFRKIIFLIVCIGINKVTVCNGFYPWGNDSDLFHSHTRKLPNGVSPMTKLFAEPLIHFHQRVISPVDGPRSHFKPSSSNYTLLAMQRYGFLIGFIMGADRLLRENSDPWIYRLTISDGKLYKWDPEYKPSRAEVAQHAVRLQL